MMELLIAYSRALLLLIVLTACASPSSYNDAELRGRVGAVETGLAEIKDCFHPCQLPRCSEVVERVTKLEEGLVMMPISSFCPTHSCEPVEAPPEVWCPETCEIEEDEFAIWCTCTEEK